EILNTKTKKPSFEILYNEKAIAKIALKSNQKFASIRLKIQNFNAVENQIIQYKFDDSNWLKTRNKGINFQSVSYGDHKITIRIKDVNSDWEIKTFEICRAYPFYLKWWFFVLVALVLIAILTLIYRNQINKINKKKQQEIATNNQIIELRQNALSAMMNPHFIFNSLSAGQYFINSNQQEKSSEHIGKLARLVRLFLSQSSASFISIADEIKRLQLYVELEQVRFNNFQFELQVDQKINVLETKIPNMIVQPFIENAILHGISNPKINDGKIELKIALNDTIITIEIIDNGFGIEESKSKNDNHISKGISIIEERLSILQKSNPTKVFSITQDFAFLNSERKGHKVVVKTTILD
ncbi:MAG: histidine kinase, partial [Flavobacteriaceae bacterium]|nr:histidine kinase [Flavobacteriaceae bacterium]